METTIYVGNETIHTVQVSWIHDQDHSVGQGPLLVLS